MARKRDFQRQRVYDFSNYHFRKNPYFLNIALSKAQCGEMVGYVLRDYDFTLPYWVSHFEDNYIKRGRNGRRATCWSGTHCVLINFPVGMRNSVVVLHEVAHALTPKDRHGPLFMATFLELMGQYRGIDVDWHREQAEAYGLKLAPRDACPERVGRSRKYVFST